MDFKELSHRPLKLKRNRVRRPFKGGLLLDRWQGAKAPADGYIPEEWVASAVRAVNPNPAQNEGLSKVVVNAGGELLLKELLDSCPEDFLGPGHVKRNGSNMGVLVKVLDSCSRLLIQVHPDKSFAKEVFRSDFGKTEAWYIIGGRKINGEDPYVLLGFKQGITKQDWVRMFENQDVKGMEDSLHKFYVKPGDVFFVEGGIPHAAGAGVFFMEIQEPTDITIRTERRNLAGQIMEDSQLHQGAGFERMFECFHYDGYTREEILGRLSLSPIIKKEDICGRELDIIPPGYTPCFSMKKLEVVKELVLADQGTFSVAVVVSGEGSITWDGGTMEVRQSEELFLPANLGSTIWKRTGNDRLDVVICYPPM